jgi:MFS family permease
VSEPAAPQVPSTRRILTGYFVLSGLYTLSAAAIWGVNTLFLLDAGLSFFEVFLANAAFSAGMVLFEVPTGVVADTLGRRVSFLLSLVVLAVTTLLYVALAEVDAGVVAFAVVSVLMGLGFTFYSGAMEAWLVDALAVTGHHGPLDGIFARGQQITGAAMLVGTVGGGLLGQIDLSLPYLVRSGLLVAVFGIAYAVMHDVGFTPRRVTVAELPSAVARNARDGVAYGWAQRPLRLLMLASFFQLGFSMWAFYASQPYMLDLLGSDAVWIAGLVTAGIALSTIAGNQLVEVLSRRCGRRTTLLLGAATVETGAAVALGLVSSFWLALPALLLIMGASGVTSPVRQAYLHQVVPSDKRATVVSFDSMISNTGGVGGQVGLGALGESRSVGAAFVAGGIVTGLALPLLGRVRAIGGAPDRIVGTKAGVESPCAASGLPAVAAIETAPVQKGGAPPQGRPSLSSPAELRAGRGERVHQTVAEVRGPASLPLAGNRRRETVRSGARTRLRAPLDGGDDRSGTPPRMHLPDERRHAGGVRRRHRRPGQHVVTGPVVEHGQAREDVVVEEVEERPDPQVGVVVRARPRGQDTGLDDVEPLEVVTARRGDPDDAQARVRVVGDAERADRGDREHPGDLCRRHTAVVPDVPGHGRARRPVRADHVLIGMLQVL